MGNYWNFYLPQSHPTGLSGQVGGSISEELLNPEVGALFSDQTTNDLGSQTQYRKVFAKQDGAGTYNNVYVEVTNAEYTGQISFAIIGDGGDLTGYADNAQTLPALAGAADFTGLAGSPITGRASSTQGDAIGIWLKQEIPAGSEDEDQASFILRVRANRIS